MRAGERERSISYNFCVSERLCNTKEQNVCNIASAKYQTSKSNILPNRPSFTCNEMNHSTQQAHDVQRGVAALTSHGERDALGPRRGGPEVHLAGVVSLVPPPHVPHQQVGGGLGGVEPRSLLHPPRLLVSPLVRPPPAARPTLQPTGVVAEGEKYRILESFEYFVQQGFVCHYASDPINHSLGINHIGITVCILLETVP